VTTIIASEIRRIHAKYGVNAILQQGEGHGESKVINTPHGQPGLLLKAMGGFTSRSATRIAGRLVLGIETRMGPGHSRHDVPRRQYGQGLHGSLGDDAVLELRPGDHSLGFTGQFPSRLSFWWKEIGMKQIYICPEVNYGAAVHADKWIPILPTPMPRCNWPSLTSGSRKAATRRIM